MFDGGVRLSRLEADQSFPRAARLRMILNLEMPSAQSGWTEVLQLWKKLNDSEALGVLSA